MDYHNFCLPRERERERERERDKVRTEVVKIIKDHETLVRDIVDKMKFMVVYLSKEKP